MIHFPANKTFLPLYKINPVSVCLYEMVQLSLLLDDVGCLNLSKTPLLLDDDDDGAVTRVLYDSGEDVVVMLLGNGRLIECEYGWV